MSLAGIPALQFQIERIRKSSYVDDIVVATTVNDKDDAIVKMICLYFENQRDYARMYDFPDGFGVQVYGVETLMKVDSLTDDPEDRVHVTYYIYTYPEVFQIAA
jgi:spore coat polysaccharide biosynthesis protein SpsF